MSSQHDNYYTTFFNFFQVEIILSHNFFDFTSLNAKKS